MKTCHVLLALVLLQILLTAQSESVFPGQPRLSHALAQLAHNMSHFA